MEADLVQQGVDLMLFGMGTVFSFLTVLVVSTSLMSFLVQRFLPEPVVLESVSSSSRKSQRATQAVDARTLAVIKEAIAQHRASKP